MATNSIHRLKINPLFDYCPSNESNWCLGTHRMRGGNGKKGTANSSVGTPSLRIVSCQFPSFFRHRCSLSPASGARIDLPFTPAPRIPRQWPRARPSLYTNTTSPLSDTLLISGLSGIKKSDCRDTLPNKIIEFPKPLSSPLLVSPTPLSAFEYSLRQHPHTQRFSKKVEKRYLTYFFLLNQSLTENF